MAHIPRMQDLFELVRVKEVALAANLQSLLALRLMIDKPQDQQPLSSNRERPS
jgi:hypothetical protein